MADNKTHKSKKNNIFRRFPVGWILAFIIFIVIVNSFNLIDGVDGLAGSLGLMTSLVFGI